jgi:hypothetical protein
MTIDNNKDEEERYLKVLRKIDVGEDEFEINIPLVTFSEDLGRLFFSELRNTKIDQSFQSQTARMYFKSLAANMIHYEISKHDKIKLGVFLTHVLIRNMTYEKDDIYGNEIEEKILKISKRKVAEMKLQNFVDVDKEFVSKYYV